MRFVRDLRSVGLVYTVTASGIRCIVAAGGDVSPVEFGPLREHLPRIDALRAELRDTMAVARGRTPHLRSFSDDWGRALIPPAILDTPPDILVVVPNGPLHGLPFHLVRLGDGRTLGEAVGITYASSMTLFRRCAARNAARRPPHAAWQFDPTGRSRPRKAYKPSTLVGSAADMHTGEHRLFAEIPASIAGHVREAILFPGANDWPPAAPREAVKTRLQPGLDSGDIFCVVAHGFLDVSIHGFSGLVLYSVTGATRRLRLYGGYHWFSDMPMTGPPPSVPADMEAEILTSSELEIDGYANSQIALLFGCSAGWSRLLQGDEPGSLAETFLHIGVPSVVAPMWDSDYGTTRTWAEAFVDGWVTHGLPKALAASRAQKAVLAVDDRLSRIGPLALRGDWL